MRQLIVWSVVSFIIVLASPAGIAASPLQLQSQVPAQAPANSSDTPELLEFLDSLDPLKNSRFTSDCPTPLECIAICESQGCTRTDGCDGMGGCLCSGCC